MTLPADRPCPRCGVVGYLSDSAPTWPWPLWARCDRCDTIYAAAMVEEKPRQVPLFGGDAR